MLSFSYAVFFATAAISSVLASTSCKLGWSNLFGDKCYRMTHDQLDWGNARALCRKYGGDLVSIHSQAENEAIRAALPGCCAYWIGLNCNSSSELIWSDGTAVDYNNIEESGSCDPTQAYYIRSTDGAWIINPTSDELINLLCEIGGSLLELLNSRANRGVTRTTPSPPTGGSECGLGYELLPDGSCVKICTNDTTWSDAEFACQQDGAHLATINFLQSNDFIRRLALSQRITNAIFIGFQLENQTGIWQDGSDIEYTNFDPGMPNEIYGACGALQTGSLQGEWTSIFCDDTNQLPYACSKPQPCPVQNTFTISGDFSSPEYPSSLSAGLYCEYFIGASPGSLVLLRFNEFQLVDGDKVILYDGEGDSEPLAVITSAAPSDSFMTKNRGVMRVVHLTGNGVGVRKWHANFVSF